MKANVPRSWQHLPQGERDRITDYALQVAKDQLEKDMRVVLDLYIKMVCVTLHDAFGFGEKRLYTFLGNHRRLFTRQRNMVKNGTQVDYLNRRMAEIFKRNGFPKEFFDDLLGEIPDEITNKEKE